MPGRRMTTVIFSADFHQSGSAAVGAGWELSGKSLKFAPVMIYISREGEVIRTDHTLNAVVDLYDAWQGGLPEITLNTSGSTGAPKRITLTREAILASVKLTVEAFDLHSSDFFLCNLNTDYIAGKMMVIRAAETGCDLMAVPPSANPFAELENQASLFARNRGNNFFSFVPLQLQNILNNDSHTHLLCTAKAILAGGAPVPEDTRQKIEELQLPVFETYGMTETISHIALKDLRSGEPFFTSLPGVNLETDEHGCLRIQSPSTLNQWITTHDVVEMVSSGKFILKGRRDNIINSGGVKIQAEEVERAIAAAFPTLGNFFCYGLPDDTLGQRLVLVIEGDGPEPDLSLPDLPRYHIPKNIIRVKEFVKTPSGKTDKIKTIAS